MTTIKLLKGSTARLTAFAAAFVLALLMSGVATAIAEPGPESPNAGAAAEEQAYLSEEAAIEQAEAVEDAAYAATDRKAEEEYPGYARRIAHIKSEIVRKQEKKRELRELPQHKKRRKVFRPQKYQQIIELRHHLHEVKLELRAKMEAANT